MEEPVPVESHERTVESTGVDVPATEDLLALPPLPPPTPTETEALMRVYGRVEGESRDSVTEREATEPRPAGSVHSSSSPPAPHTPPDQIRSLRELYPRDTSDPPPSLTSQGHTPATSRYIETPPDLQNACSFRASNRAPAFLRGSKLLMGSLARHPPESTGPPYGLAGTHRFVSDRGRLYWSDGHSLSGTFGTIFTVTLEEAAPVVMVKILANSEAWLLPRKREEYVYRSLDDFHPGREHILSFYGTFDLPGSREPFAIVLEKCTITLADVLQAHYNRVTWYPTWREKLPECFTKIAIAGILTGLRYLAEKSILHRSLRPEQVVIILDQPRRGMVIAKLADFTYASNLSLTTPEYLTPLAYTPPDVVFAGKSFDHSSDLWCAGCILAHMLLGRQLVSATTRENYLVSFRPYMLWEMWFTERIYYNQLRPESWPKLTPAMVRFMYENDSRHDRNATALLRSLLQFRPLSRASAADALRMRYIRFGSFEEMYSRMWLMELC